MICSITGCKDSAYHNIEDKTFCAMHYNGIVKIAEDTERFKLIKINLMKQDWHIVMVSLNAVSGKMKVDDDEEVARFHHYLENIINHIRKEAELA